MLAFRRIEIDNFVCFDHIVVEPSIDPDRPLTVIRAENGSGKTTFLRAVRWAMYGEQGLPDNFGLHPAWWEPDKDGMETTVTLEFETDGSSRNAVGDGGVARAYQIVRSVSTIAAATSRSDGRSFHRIKEKTNVLVQNRDGTWQKRDTVPDRIVAELLPWELRDFFVMDADEVTDFAGGTDDQHGISRLESLRKTTYAVQSLLGINVFKDTRDRLEKLARTFGGQAANAIGDRELDDMQDELDRLHTNKDDLTQRISDDKELQTQLVDDLQRRRNDLENELRKSGAHDDLQDRREKNKRGHESALRKHEENLAILSGALESVELLAPLCGVAVGDTYELLRELHDSGHIPLTHLHFVRSLIDDGICVCGQDISFDGEHRQRIVERIEQSVADEGRANYLYQLHDAARTLQGRIESSRWAKDLTGHRAALVDCDTTLEELDLEKRNIDERLSQIDEPKIQLLRDEIDAFEKKVSHCKSNLVRREPELEQVTEEITSLSRKIDQRKRNRREAADASRCEWVSRRVVEMLHSAYRTIEHEQVKELSDGMHRLFRRMAANVATEEHDSRAGLDMIEQVGVQPSADRSDHFELFARNSHGRDMPPTQINGASRRVLALAFVLALCRESQTRAPLIADSLLNSMSGPVRRNALRVTAEHSQQPVLLLTYADLESSPEIETISRFGGSTYTLTGQWDVSGGGNHGDVIRLTESRKVSLLCRCGPRQYCDICERVGQAESPGWTRREN
jgi:DNA sulfur modification protein DndD